MDADELSVEVGNGIESLMLEHGYTEQDVLEIVSNALQNVQEEQDGS